MPVREVTKNGEYRIIQWDNDSILLEVSEEVVEEFKLLVKRGANTFERASPETKQFVDLLLYGRAQQDYHSMPQFRGSEHGKSAGES